MLTKSEIEAYDLNPIIRLCYDWVYPISEDRVLATHGGQISLITRAGEMICTYDSIQIPTYDTPEKTFIDPETNIETSVPQYVGDLLLVRQDNLWGVIDYDGEIVVYPRCRRLKFLSDDLFESF